MPVDQIEEALSQLDIGERALLDLSVHRGFDDERIAKLLDIDVSEVSAQRRAALEKLFRLRAASGDGARDEVRDELRSVSDKGWIDPGTGRKPGEGEKPARRVRPALIASALAMIAIVAGAVALIAAGGGDDSDPSGSTAQSKAPSAPIPAPTPSAPVSLQPLDPGAAGSVTASVIGSGASQRLTVQLSGLAPPKSGGAYELWLYDSLTDSRALGSVEAGSGKISARLPGDASSFKWLDLSLQPGADRAHHSGESVFRAPLSGVLR